MVETTMPNLQTLPGDRLRSGFSKRRRAMLSHLQSALLNKLYRSLLGTQYMSSALYRRAVAAGLKGQHLDNLCHKSKTQSDLPIALASAGETYFQRGLYWHDVGVRSRACDHYLESSLYYLYAAMLTDHQAVKAKAFARCQSSYLLAAPQFTIPAELVGIAYPAGTVSGYLRLPVRRVEAGADAHYIANNFPCVILFNSLNAAKEELHFMENAFLTNGIATLSFDYPGLCCHDELPAAFSFNLEELVNSLLLFLASRNEIDISRVSLFGTSVGGRLALYAAAKFPERFRAVVSISAPLDLLSDLQLLLPAMQKELAASQKWSRASVFDLARGTPLRQMLGSISTPVLAIGGSADPIATADETRTIFKECGSTDKQLMICNGAHHNCYEMMPSLRHELVSWMKQRLQ
jgi:alpha-beta hydrolase superfamily lysophospholipase